MEQLIWEPEMVCLSQTTSKTVFLNQKMKTSMHIPDVSHVKVRDVLSRLYAIFCTATKKNINKSMSQILEIIFT